jgi:predicted RNA-binding Zn ribbon-like protein
METLRLDMVVAFLNSLDERHFGHHAGKTERDQLATPAALKRWLVARDLLGSRAHVTAADVRAASELRDRLRDLLASDADSGHALTALARHHPLVVSFEGEPTLKTPTGGVPGFLAAVLGACAGAALEGQWVRLKMCAAPDCRFVFHDRGRNRLGRWCAMEACGNRMKMRSYRARQTGAPAKTSRAGERR